MNKELQNLQDGEIFKDIFEKYAINGKNYYVVAEIKKGYYTRVYINNALVAEIKNATIAGENMLLGLCKEWISMADKKISQTSGAGVMFYPEDFYSAGLVKTYGNYKLKFIYDDNIYSYIDDQTTMYRNYTPDVVGLLAAKFEAEQKLKELHNSEPQR